MEIIDKVQKKKRINKKCEHGKRKQQCRKCNGSSFCEHGNIKYKCKKCGGSSLCEHGREKYYCRNCEGGSFCEHGKYKKRCIKCGGSSMCEHCKYTRKNSKYGNGNYCVPCYIFLNPNSEVAKGNRVLKQDVIDNIYMKMYPDFIWETKDKSLPNDCGVKRRPDYFIDYGTHCLILEIDENQHKNYNKQCEISRLNEISTMVNDKPTIYIRFNPDSYKGIDGNKVDSCFTISPGIGKLKPLKRKIKERLQIVHQEVLKYSDYNNVKNIIKNNLIHQIYLFFDKIDY